MTTDRPRYLRTDTRGATALVFGLAALPLFAMVALAIDFTGAVFAKARLDMAADAAALAAVMSAENLYAANPAAALDPAIADGVKRFNAQAGAIAGVSLQPVEVQVTKVGAMFDAVVTYQAAFATAFAGIVGVPTWPISGSAATTLPVGDPYLNVTILLDNSPSMEIGAMPSDIETLQALTACAPSGAYYLTNKKNNTWSQIQTSAGQPASGQAYNAYQCTSGGNTYDGSPSCPISGFTPSSSTTGPNCTKLALYNGQYPRAGAPCAFACHFDTSKAAGTSNDYFQTARSTIGQANQVTLRFDIVKAAVNTLIATMQSDDLPIRNLKVGVFTFDSALTRVYPPSGEAGDGWATAMADVGAPPTAPNQPDTGIQPYGGANAADTDFPGTMTALAGELTASGDGSSAASPRKVLFLVTDGVQDYFDATGARHLQALDPTYCTTFKNKGFTVYVVYMPYYPLMNAYYLQNMTTIVEGTGPTSTTYNLQACASSPSAYISASDSASLQAALQTFLQRAQTAPARFTQ